MFTQISASVSFRRLPRASFKKRDHTHIYRWSADNNVFVRGAGTRSARAYIYLKLEMSRLSIPILDPASFLQLSADSASFRAGGGHASAYIPARRAAIYVGGKP